MFYKGTLRLA